MPAGYSSRSRSALGFRRQSPGRDSARRVGGRFGGCPAGARRTSIIVAPGRGSIAVSPRLWIGSVIGRSARPSALRLTAVAAPFSVTVASDESCRVHCCKVRLDAAALIEGARAHESLREGEHPALSQREKEKRGRSSPWVNPAQPPSVSRCAPRSRSPVSLIVLTRSCSRRWGPCPSPTPCLEREFLVLFVCPFYLFIYSLALARCRSSDPLGALLSSTALDVVISRSCETSFLGATASKTKGWMGGG